MKRNPNRCIIINGEINAEVANGVMADLLTMEQEPGDITVRITSGGGETMFGLAIFDALRLSKCDVTTEAFGEVYSSAFLIFQAGDVRKVAPRARLMWHDGSIEVRETLTPAAARALIQDLVGVDDLCNKAVAERIGVPVETVEAWSHATTYWTADQAVKDRLADEVLS